MAVRKWDVKAGRARLQAEARRVELVRAKGAPPSGASDAIGASPARGVTSVFRDTRMVAVGAKGFEEIEERYPGGAPTACRDNFDDMTDQALRARGGMPPFTIGQVHAGRAYRALHERIEGSGLKMSSAFSDGVGGAGDVDFMDAFRRDRERLAAFHRAIGAGVAKDVRRKVPVTEGRVVVGAAMIREIGRTLITVRVLVDYVCLREQSLSAVLRVHGWAGSTKNLESVRRALCGALGRMEGV